MPVLRGRNAVMHIGNQRIAVGDFVMADNNGDIVPADGTNGVIMGVATRVDSENNIATVQISGMYDVPIANRNQRVYPEGFIPITATENAITSSNLDTSINLDTSMAEEQIERLTKKVKSLNKHLKYTDWLLRRIGNRVLPRTQLARRRRNKA